MRTLLIGSVLLRWASSLPQASLEPEAAACVESVQDKSLLQVGGGLDRVALVGDRHDKDSGTDIWGRTIKQWWQDANWRWITQDRQVHGPKIVGRGGPVVIGLHGFGGESQSQPEGVHDICYFGPSGDQKSWNVGGEPSKAPDVDFISKIVDLAEHVSGCDVSQGVTVVGYSNGCAMIHRLLIESQDSRLKKFACGVTQLTTFQYRHGKFQRKKAENACKKTCRDADWMPVTKPPLGGRVLYNILAGKDTTCPARGGHSGVSGGVEFLSGEESIKIWQGVFGQNNAKLWIDWKVGHWPPGDIWKWKVAELIRLPSP